MKNQILFLLIAFIAKQSYSQKLEPTEKDAKLNVTVLSEKKKPQEGETVIFESAKTKKSFSGVTKADGKFSILVPKGDKYNIKYKTFTSDKQYTSIDVPDKKGELIEFDVDIQFELPKQYTLDNVYFETGKADIKPTSFKEIDELAEFMKLRKNISIEIAGHTDNVGAADANLKLSQSRAEAVKNYLVKKGIDAARVQAKGYGDTQPIESNDTDAGKKRNRRTEVRIIKE